jgi:hypothetical protein
MYILNYTSPIVSTWMQLGHFTHTLPPNCHSKHAVSPTDASKLILQVHNILRMAQNPVCVNLNTGFLRVYKGNGVFRSGSAFSGFLVDIDEKATA